MLSLRRLHTTPEVEPGPPEDAKIIQLPGADIGSEEAFRRFANGPRDIGDHVVAPYPVMIDGPGMRQHDERAFRLSARRERTHASHDLYGPRVPAAPLEPNEMLRRLQLDERRRDASTTKLGGQALRNLAAYEKGSEQEPGGKRAAGKTILTVVK